MIAGKKMAVPIKSKLCSFSRVVVSFRGGLSWKKNAIAMAVTAPNGRLM